MLFPIETLNGAGTPTGLLWRWGKAEPLQGTSNGCFDLCPTVAGTPSDEIALGATSAVETMDVPGVGRWVITTFGGVRFYHAFGLQAEDVTAAPRVQMDAVFGKMEKLLAVAKLLPTQIARTWLYVDQIDDTYEPLNQARDTFFKRVGIYDKALPASTGIGCPNTSGSVFQAGVLAVAPMDGSQPEVVWEEAASPLQGPATDYRKSFSRATAVETTEGTVLYVSGTASIAPTGETIYLDDIEGQIKRTMEVVHGILGARAMDWAHTTRAIAYLKYPEYIPVWQAWLKSEGLPEDFAQVMIADVCRSGLLFELELDAFRASHT